MAARPLPSQDYLRECFSYDRETGIVMWRQRPLHHFKSEVVQRQWNTKHLGKRAGNPLSGTRYLCVGLFGSLWGLHRIIWRMETGEEVPQVDHRDCDGTNNKWNNLRAATHETNVLNQRGWNGRDLPKGVSRHGRNFRAIIQFRKKSHSLGTYRTVVQAAEAYAEAAQRLHGEFANLGAGTRGDGSRGHP